MRLGFIGAGFISSFHATALTMVRGVEVSGVLRRSRSPQLAQHCQALGVGSPVEYDTVGDVVRNCDVVAIYNPNFLRIETMQEIVDAVEAGASLVGVVIEKPLGRTMKEARTLVELAKKAGLKTAYFENQVFNEVDRCPAGAAQAVHRCDGRAEPRPERGGARRSPR
jgi:predicted dehydrogenase